MKIFALETDEEKLMRSFLSRDEEVILRVKFSAFLFAVRSLKALCFTAVFVAAGAALSFAQLPIAWHVPVLAILWLFFVGFRWFTAFIDWRYDMLLVTSEEIVVIDQSSLFHVKIRQMNLDNVASVAAETMYGNILPFGRLHFELKEGMGTALELPYVPYAQRVANIISDAMVMFQRRRAAMMGSLAKGVSSEQARHAAERAVPAPPPRRITDEGMEKA